MNSNLARLRYDSLAYLALNVSDIEKSAHFYEKIVGLQPAGVGPGGEPLFRCSASHHDIMLCQGGTPGLRRIGWRLESEDAYRFAEGHVEQLGLAPVRVPAAEAAALGFDEALRFREPTTGTLFEFGWSAAPAQEPFKKTHTAIARLGHVVIASADRLKTERFLTDHLNFRVSDRITDTVSFMRCFPNPYHHSFGVSQGNGPALAHVNFMVTEIDDIGKATNRMKDNAVKVVYGPGRHPPSESVFFYFLDPDDLTLEYSFGMEEFAEVEPRQPRELPKSLESIDYWGGVPDPKFCATGAIDVGE